VLDHLWDNDVRYYTILINEGKSATIAGTVNGLASNALGMILNNISPNKQKIIGRRNIKLNDKRNSVGSFDSVSFNNPTASTTFNNAVQTNLNNLGAPLKIPPTLNSIVGAPINGAQFTSVVNGHNDPGALDIEFDITDNGDGHLKTAWLKIYGINQSLISQATSLNGRRLQLYAGFSDGLPLANQQVPHQGLILDGMIQPCYGNWIGNELSMEFIVIEGLGGPGGPTDPKNIIHNMPIGTTLSSAISNALGTAFPDFNINVNINDSLALGNPDQGFHQSIEQYQNYVKELSQSILGNQKTTGYRGISFSSSGNTINVSDGSKVDKVIDIQYSDLIGQPTWSPQGENVLQIKTALRGDISTSGAGGNVHIRLPLNLLVSTPRSASNLFIAGDLLQYQPGDVLNFQGEWEVTSVRHVGRFRQPTGENWVSIIDAITPFTTGGGETITTSSGKQTFKQDRPQEY
jgi:hypothetical protein